jgi:hypothetical protein
MATMMRYTFSALITLSPAPEDPAPRCPSRVHARAADGYYLIQPFSLNDAVRRPGIR